MSMGFYSYLLAALAYGFFALLLLFSWKDSRQSRLLLLAMLVSTAWALAASGVAEKNPDYLLWYQSLEVLRYLAWYVFLLKLFDVTDGGEAAAAYQRFSRRALPFAAGFSVLLLGNEMVASRTVMPGQYLLGIAGNVILALIALAILEQLFRNTAPRFRWAMKYLFLSAGCVFAYDFYLYADALLFRSVDPLLWQARGVVHLLAVPLLAIASARNKNWSMNVFVSRDVVFNTTAILAGGFYLLFMALAGYYLREFGGSWGQLGQIVFIVVAVVSLLVLISSSQLRAAIRVFLGKHFYKNKYDYRLEWLRLTDELNQPREAESPYQAAVQALAQIVEARAGGLWLRDEQSGFVNRASWHERLLPEPEPENSPFVSFLKETGYVVTLAEVGRRPHEYSELKLPEWIGQLSEPWLVVPLKDTHQLLGFIVLCKPLVERTINWEDRDLMKAAANQIASHLAVILTSAELAEAKQFELFSRLSAYMVHDLKNIAAELDLIALNARKYSANPEFVEDAFATVEHAADDINRLLEQLRNRRLQTEKKVLVDLVALLQEAASPEKNRKPIPQFEAPQGRYTVALERGRLMNVLAHLIDNARQATGEQGRIVIRLRREAFDNVDMHVIEIEDNGHGMDETFIRERLFKAFDTTKGNAGMGIGMYESREFICQSGGDITVTSEVGKGTIISLMIPAAEQQARADEPAVQQEGNG